MSLPFRRPARATFLKAASLSLVALSLFPHAAGAQAPARIKWACIGNSLTAGYPQANLTYVSGARRLASLIGPQDTLLNAGVSGLTLLKKGDRPYWTQGKLSQVFAFQPDIISIELGTNDTKAVNWQHENEFVADLTRLVDTLSTMASKPDIWLMLPPPIYTNTFGIRDSVLTHGVIPKIQQVAAAKGLKILDANTRMRAITSASPSTFYSDGVHFTARGADSLAAVIYRSFISQVIRVAAIGNSITAGSTLTNAAASSYPTRLNMRLGRKYYVRNEGISGAYMQKNGNLPYWTTAQFRDVFAFQPHLITIALGTNDSRATRWNTQRFMNDYRAMLDTLSTIPTQPKFWLIKPMPAWYDTNNSTVNPSVPAWGFDNGTAGNGINGFTIRDSVHPAIDTIAAERNLPVIDLYGPMLMGQTYVHTATPSHTPDGVHPKELGHDTISAVVYRGMGPGLPTSIAASSRDPGRSTTAKGNLRVNTASEAAAGVSSGRSYTLDGKTLVPGTTQAAGVRVTQPVERQEAR